MNLAGINKTTTFAPVKKAYATTLICVLKHRTRHYMEPYLR